MDLAKATDLVLATVETLEDFRSDGRLSNLKYESVRIDFKAVVFIRANPGKKETPDGSGSHVNFIQTLCTFPKW